MQREHTQQNIPDKVMEPEEEGSIENQDNEEWKPEEIDELKKIERNFIDIGPFVAEVCRYSVSDRAASAMFNAAVKCLNTAAYIVTKEGESFEEKLNTDKCKIRREKRKFAKKEKNRLNKENIKGIECLGTDGKNVVVVVDGEEVEKTEKGTEEHVIYTKEPGQ